MFDGARAITLLRIKLRKRVVSRGVLGVQLDISFQRLEGVLPVVPALLELRQLEMRGPEVGIGPNRLTEQRLHFGAWRRRIGAQRAGQEEVANRTIGAPFPKTA